MYHILQNGKPQTLQGYHVLKIHTTGGKRWTIVCIYSCESGSG